MSERAVRYAKAGLFIALAIVVGILLGRVIGSYELRFMLDRKYCGNYKGIDVYKTGNVNEENYRSHVKMLAYAPDALMESCDTIYFTGNDLAIPMTDLGFDSALGLTQQKTVYVSTAGFDPDVLIHELFHTYDYSFGTLSDNDEDFLDAYETEKGKILVTAGIKENHAAEYFAVAGSIYILSPNDLIEMAPFTFNYFNGLFGLYEVNYS